MNMEGPLAPNVLDGGTLKPEFAKKGVKLSRFVDPEITYHYWNLQDPVVGGLTKEKIALRRAMAMAYNVNEEIKVVRNGQAVEAQYPIPPGVVGHEPALQVERQVRPGRRQRAARPLRLQEGRRRLAHAARRQAARDPLRVAPRFARPPAGRDVEEGVRLDRHPDGSAEGPVSRSS